MSRFPVVIPYSFGWDGANPFPVALPFVFGYAFGDTNTTATATITATVGRIVNADASLSVSANSINVDYKRYVYADSSALYVGVVENQSSSRTTLSGFSSELIFETTPIAERKQSNTLADLSVTAILDASAYRLTYAGSSLTVSTAVSADILRYITAEVLSEVFFTTNPEIHRYVFASCQGYVDALVDAAAIDLDRAETTVTVNADISAEMDHLAVVDAELNVIQQINQSTANVDAVSGFSSSALAETYQDLFHLAPADSKLDVDVAIESFALGQNETATFTHVKVNISAEMQHHAVADTDLNVVQGINESNANLLAVTGSETSLIADAYQDLFHLAPADARLDVDTSIDASALEFDVSDSDTQVQVDISASMQNLAVADTGLDVVQDVNESVAHVSAVSGFETNLLADIYQDLFHVANVDSYLSVTSYQQSGFFVLARSGFSTSVDAAISAVSNSSAVSGFCSTVEAAISSGIRLAAVSGFASSVSVSVTANEIGSVVVQTSTLVSTAISAGSSYSAVTSAATNVLSQSVNSIRSALSAHAVSDLVWSEVTTLVKQRFVQSELDVLLEVLSIASKPLFFVMVPARDKSANVLASTRIAAVSSSSRTAFVESLVQSRSVSVEAVVKNANTGLA